MLESNSEISKTTSSPAKRVFIGLVFFAIICIAITYACIYLTLEDRKQTNENYIDNQTTNEEVVVPNSTSNNKVLKLTDKAYLNGITEIMEKESYGEVVDYLEYDNTTVQKLEIEYVQISGLKDRNVQTNINQVIKDMVNEIKESDLLELDDENIERICIVASIYGNFADVISVHVEEFIRYDFNDEDFENDDYIINEHCLNFSLETGELLKFKDLFWEGSPIKTILSQCAYKAFALNYATSIEDYEWDYNMDNLDYSVIESKVYNFMYKYNQNPDIDFYFTTSNIEIPLCKNFNISIDMADFYEYIAIYTKYKSSNNLYEDNLDKKEFYVFATDTVFRDDYVKESGKKADNIYYRIYCYDSIENMSDDGEKAYQMAYQAIVKKINEYVKVLENDENSGYIIEGVYAENEYEIQYGNAVYGYYFEIEIARCDRNYLDNHLEDALAAGARAQAIDIYPSNYAYIDRDNFEFYERYTEWMDDYTDETTIRRNTYNDDEQGTSIEELEDFEEYVEIEG